jgi:ABC-type transport system involved in cytochrome c biogenesis ATPase subunit
MKNVLVMYKLLFRYQNQLIFYNINCTLSSGSVLLIKGENGTGKSTLIRCLLQLLPMQSGIVLWQKQLLLNNENYLKAHTQLLQPRTFLLYDHLNVFENLIFRNQFLNYKTLIDYTLLIKLFYLFKQKNSSVKWLSLGQIKRLILTFFLTSSTPIWFLDEPLIGLDIKSLALFQAILQNHRKHGGISIIISHTDFLLVRCVSLQL